MPQSGKIAVVTVHGTGDTAKSADGPKWFQRGSAFSERLKQLLAQRGVDADIVPHLWSGANSAWERERGANGLARHLRKLFKDYETIHVVGHSHGGNVANDAAVLLKWGLRGDKKYEKFDSLTTVGTPFIDTRTSWPQLLAGIVFMILAYTSAITFPITVLISLATMISRQDFEYLWAVGVYVAIFGPCILFMLNMSRQGVRRILRPRRGGKTKTAVFALWHDNDEAISFLRRVEELPLEPFPRGALFRGSRSAAVAWGVLVVIATALAWPVLYGMGIDPLNMKTIFPSQPGAEATFSEYFGEVFAVTVFGLWFAPPLFVVAYFIWRFIVGGAQEITVRGPMNGFVVGVLRGIALGRDGDQVLCNVSTKSHTHQTEEYVLAGDCASRMQAGAHDAAGKLIDKYRWALFQVGGDSSASLTSLTTDAMTWDSLIHTTYFDQPEVVEVIAAYIAAKAKDEAFAPPGFAPAPAPETPPPGDLTRVA